GSHSEPQPSGDCARRYCAEKRKRRKAPECPNRSRFLARGPPLRDGPHHRPESFQGERLFQGRVLDRVEEVPDAESAPGSYGRSGMVTPRALWRLCGRDGQRTLYVVVAGPLLDRLVQLPRPALEFLCRDAGNVDRLLFAEEIVEREPDQARRRTLEEGVDRGADLRIVGVARLQESFVRQPA